MDWISEAVYQFYQVHLDGMIRKNDKLWGDFFRKRYVWNDELNKWDEYLDLSKKGFDMRDPTTVFPSTEKKSFLNQNFIFLLDHFHGDGS